MSSVLLSAVLFSSLLSGQAPQFGGVYLFEASRFTYPNGVTWGPHKQHIYIPLTEKQETIIYLPGVMYPFTGPVSQNFASTQSPVFGADFEKAPGIIQRKIEATNLIRDLSLAIEDKGARLRGVLEMPYATWVGEELKEIKKLEHNITLTRVECQVKNFEYRVDGFDEVFEAREPERSKEIAEATKKVSAAKNEIDKVLLEFRTSTDEVKNAIENGANYRKAIITAIGDMDQAGIELENAALKKVKVDIVRLDSRQKQIAERLAAIRRDMPNTPASVVRELETESNTNARQLATKRQERLRLEKLLGIDNKQMKARVKVEDLELELVKFLRSLDKTKVDRDTAAAKAVAKYEFYLYQLGGIRAAIMSRKFEPSPVMPVLDKVTVESGGVVFEARQDQPFLAQAEVGNRVSTTQSSVNRINGHLLNYRQEFAELRRLLLNDAEAMVSGPLSSSRAEDPVKVNQTNNEIVATCLTNTVNELSGFLADELQKTALVSSAEWDEFLSYRVMSPGANDIYAAEVASAVFVRRRGRDQLQWDFMDKLSQQTTPDSRSTQMNLKTGLEEAPFGKANDLIRDRWRVFVQTSNASLELPWKRMLIDNLGANASLKDAMSAQETAVNERVDKLSQIRHNYRDRLNESTFSQIADLAMAKVNAYVSPTRSATDTQRRTIWRRMLKNGAKAKAVGLVIQRLQQARWEVLSEMKHVLDIRARIAEAMNPYLLKPLSAPKFQAVTTPKVKLTFARDGYIPNAGRMECSINRTNMTADGLMAEFKYPSTPAAYRALSPEWSLSIRVKAR